MDSAELFKSTEVLHNFLFRWTASELRLYPGNRLIEKGRQKAKIYDFFVLFTTEDRELFGKCRICDLEKPPIPYTSRTYSNLESHLVRKRPKRDILWLLNYTWRIKTSVRARNVLQVRAAAPPVQPEALWRI